MNLLLVCILGGSCVQPATPARIDLSAKTVTVGATVIRYAWCRYEVSGKRLVVATEVIWSGGFE